MLETWQIEKKCQWNKKFGKTFYLPKNPNPQSKPVTASACVQALPLAGHPFQSVDWQHLFVMRLCI